MSKIDKINSFNEAMKQNSEMVPYFDALANTDYLPKNELESALFILAKHLGLNPASPRIDDLRSAFKKSQRKKNGIYWDGGTEWQVFYNKTLRLDWNPIGTDWAISGTESPKKILAKFVSAFLSKDNADIFNEGSDIKSKEFSQRKSKMMVNILRYGVKGFQILQRRKFEHNVIKEALKKKKEKEVQLIGTTSLENLKLKIAINTVPQNALQDKSLFTLWSFTVAAMQQKIGKKPLPTHVAASLKQEIDKRDIIGSIQFLRDKYFAFKGYPLRSDFLGRELAALVNPKYQAIYWNPKTSSWRIQTKEQFKKDKGDNALGLLQNLYSEIQNSSLYRAAGKQFDTLREYASKNVPQIQENLVGQINYSSKWQTEGILSQRIPFLKNISNDWKFLKFSESNVVAYSEKTGKAANYNGKKWAEISTSDLGKHLVNKKNIETIKAPKAVKDELGKVFDINIASNTEDKVSAINKIGFVNKKFFRNKKIHEVSEINKQLLFEYTQVLKDLPLTPPGAKTVENLSIAAANSATDKLKKHISKIPKATRDQDPYLQIVISKNGEVESFKVSKKKKKETITQRAKRRAGETRNQARRLIDNLNPAQQLKTQKYIFKDTYWRIRDNIWKKNWAQYKSGRMNMAQALLKSTGQTFKHLFVDTPYRSVKFGFGAVLAMTGLSTWYMLKRRKKRQQLKQDGNITDDVQYGIKKTKGLFKGFLGFLNKFKLPGGKKPVFAGLAAALGLGWLFPKKAKAALSKGKKGLKAAARKATRLTNTVTGSATPVLQLSKKNISLYINKKLPKRTKITSRNGLTLGSPNAKIIIPALSPKSRVAAVTFSRNASKSSFYLPNGNYKVAGKKWTYWNVQYYSGGKQIEWSVKKHGKITLPAGTILPKGTQISK